MVLLSDLEKSVEELQRNSSVNHGLVTEQDVEQKSKELRTLGETLTELKSKLLRGMSDGTTVQIHCFSQNPDKTDSYLQISPD